VFASTVLAKGKRKRGASATLMARETKKKAPRSKSGNNDEGKVISSIRRE